MNRALLALWSSRTETQGLRKEKKNRRDSCLWEPKTSLWLPWMAQDPGRGLRTLGTVPRTPVPLISLPGKNYHPYMKNYKLQKISRV